jgi:adenosylcobinamide-phosphate synthase
VTSTLLSAPVAGSLGLLAGPVTVPGDPVAPAALAVAAAFSLERLFAEPPEWLHPVAWFGRAVAPVDREWSHPLWVGAAVAFAFPLAAAGVVWIAIAVAGVVSSYAAVAVAGVVLFTTTSLRMLVDRANAVVDAAGADPGLAKQRLPALAGRDPGDLSPGHLRSAAVESAAENLADGLVAPLLAFAVLAPLSLSLAGAGAAWVKSVNTLDSMLGYRSKPVGEPSARVDDLVMWLPARASAALIALVATSPDPVLTARRWARLPDSPNSGWPMGTLASALGVRLEKPGAYELNPAASLPDRRQAERGVRTVHRTGLLSYVVAAGLGVVAWL